MKFNHWAAIIVFATLAAFGASAHAIFIGGNDIIPSTSLTPVLPFTIDQIADGITSDDPPFNGFVSNSSSGIITLDLVGNYDVNEFILWNDVNVFMEGIKDYRLDFYDENNLYINDHIFYGASVGRVSGEHSFFPPVPCVSRVDLVVLNSHQGVFERIEIREVAFGGEVCVPEPTTVMLLAAGALGLIGFRLSKKTRGARKEKVRTIYA